MKKIAFIIVSISLLAGLFTARLVSADSVPPSSQGIIPERVSGNPHCTSLSGSQSWGDFRLEAAGPGNPDPDYPFEDGTFTSPDGLLTITISGASDSNMVSFDWQSAITSVRVIPLVIVKAAADAHIYDYAGQVGAIAPGDGDEGLYSVPQPSGPPNYFEVSHVAFCYPLEPTGIMLLHITSSSAGDWTPWGLALGLILLTGWVLVGRRGRSQPDLQS